MSETLGTPPDVDINMLRDASEFNGDINPQFVQWMADQGITPRDTAGIECYTSFGVVRVISYVRDDHGQIQMATATEPLLRVHMFPIQSAPPFVNTSTHNTATGQNISVAQEQA